MKISISHRFSGAVLCAVEAASWRLALEIAVKQRADLGGAYLRDANLRDANLGGANLRDADLRGANLGGADLRDANLWGANLGGADLRGANLGGANLRDANLRGANLGGANLGGANLGGANLRDANLGDANLRDANLRDADLRDANLWGADLGGARVLAVASLLIDGWSTTLWHTDHGYLIQAGCHTFTLDEAKAHYANRTERCGLYYLATEAWRVIARLQGWE